MVIRVLILCSALIASQTALGATVLYDDSAGNLPNDQPWLFYAGAGVGGVFNQTAVPAGVNATSNVPASSGYSNYWPRPISLIPLVVVPELWNPAFPSLDRGAGFALTFELQIHAESHDNDDRAGFSVILLAGDRQGIELGFWGDEIWAQSGGPSYFTHDEGQAFDTMSSEVDYRLTIRDDQYRLSAGGAGVLSGPLRDYSGAGVSQFGINPYDLPSYLFLGDDTGSAGVDYTLGRVTIGAVPLPPALAMMAVALSSLFGFRRSGGTV